MANIPSFLSVTKYTLQYDEVILGLFKSKKDILFLWWFAFHICHRTLIIPVWQHINLKFDCTLHQQAQTIPCVSEGAFARDRTKRIPSLCYITPFPKPFLVFSNPCSSLTTTLIHSRWHLIAFVSSTIVLANRTSWTIIVPLSSATLDV